MGSSIPGSSSERRVRALLAHVQDFWRQPPYLIGMKDPNLPTVVGVGTTPSCL